MLVALSLAWALVRRTLGWVWVRCLAWVSAPHAPSLANVARAYNCSDPSWERSQPSPPGKHPEIWAGSPSNGAGV